MAKALGTNLLTANCTVRSIKRAAPFAEKRKMHLSEWGKEDAPIPQVLQLMKKEKYPFAACIEYEYPGKGTAVEEVRKCREYARKALA